MGGDRAVGMTMEEEEAATSVPPAGMGEREMDCRGKGGGISVGAGGRGGEKRIVAEEEEGGPIAAVRGVGLATGGGGGMRGGMEGGWRTPVEAEGLRPEEATRGGSSGLCRDR